MRATTGAWLGIGPSSGSARVRTWAESGGAVWKNQEAREFLRNVDEQGLIDGIPALNDLRQTTFLADSISRC